MEEGAMCQGMQQLSEAEKGKETNSQKNKNLRKGTQPFWYLDFIPVRPISDSDLQNKWQDDKFVLF